MAKRKKFYYVLVFTNAGPVYVTKVDNTNKVCYWNDADKPYEFGSEQIAVEHAWALGLNGTSCVAVVSHCEKETHPYNYEDYDCTFVKKEN